MVVCTIIGSDKGGVGKSEIAALLVEARDRLGGSPSVIEIDHQAKLKNMLGARVNLSIAASATISDTSANRYAVQAHFNEIYRLWTSSESITDLGANVTTNIFEWIRDGEISDMSRLDGLTVRFVAVASPDIQALISAYEALISARSAFPLADLYLIENDLVGESGFAPYRTTDIGKKLGALVTSGQVTLVSIPYCDSKFMEYGRARGMTPIKVMQNLADVEEEIEMTRVEAATQRRKFFQWLSEIQSALKPLMIVEHI